jgi:hypothetical protein
MLYRITPDKNFNVFYDEFLCTNQFCCTRMSESQDRDSSSKSLINRDNKIIDAIIKVLLIFLATHLTAVIGSTILLGLLLL